MHETQWTDFFDTGKGRYWPFLVGAIVLGILGNSAFDLITSILIGLVEKVHVRHGLQHPIVDIVLIGFLAFSVPGVVRAIRRFGRDPAMTIPADNDIDPQPAVIAFVSLTRRGDRKPYENAVEGHISGRGREQGQCTYVRLIGSEKTRDVAAAYAARIKSEHPKVNIAVVMKTPDFMDIRQVYDVTDATIRKAFQDNPQLRPNQLVLDVTGGTALTSVGAVLAGHRYGVRIQYIDSVVDDEVKTALSDVKFKKVIFESQQSASSDGMRSGRTAEELTDHKFAPTTGR